MERLKNINYVYVLAILLLLRGVVDFSFPQACLALVVFGYLGFKSWLARMEDNKLAERIAKLEADSAEVEVVKQEVTELRTNLSGLMIKNASRPQQMKNELENRKFF